MRPLRRGEQTEMVFRTHGGKREGAGRKPKGGRARVAHVRRPVHKAGHPLHVTVKLRPIVRTLRDERLVEAAREAIGAGCQRFGFRVVEFTIERDHVHFIAEARDEIALARGMQGLSIRLAKSLNRALGRKGKVFADRYHARALETPAEVRNALGYVMNNERRHAFKRGEALDDDWVDPYSSAPHFDGWREGSCRPADSFALGPPVTVRARTWLLTTGWRRRGLIPRGEVPGLRRRRRKDGTYRVELT